MPARGNAEGDLLCPELMFPMFELGCARDCQVQVREEGLDGKRQASLVTFKIKRSYPRVCKNLDTVM